MKLHSLLPVRRTAAAWVAGVALAGCATAPPPESPQRELVVAVTDSHELITFNAGQPAQILERRPVTGLPTGERLVGIDLPHHSQGEETPLMPVLSHRCAGHLKQSTWPEPAHQSLGRHRGRVQHG